MCPPARRDFQPLAFDVRVGQHVQRARDGFAAGIDPLGMVQLTR